MALIVVMLSSITSTVSAFLAAPIKNVYWTGDLAIAQFAVPLHQNDIDENTGMTMDSVSQFDGIDLKITTAVAQKVGDPTAWLIAGFSIGYGGAIWTKQEIQRLVNWNNIWFAEAWLPVQLYSWYLMIRIELSWVTMAPTFSTIEIARVLVGGGTRVDIFGGSWNFGQAYASVSLIDTINCGGNGYSYEALVAHGNINMDLLRLHGVFV